MKREKRFDWGWIDVLGLTVFNTISASAGYTPSVYISGPDIGNEQV